LFTVSSCEYKDQYVYTSDKFVDNQYAYENARVQKTIISK